MNFIQDNSADFVLANGLLCSMTPTQHDQTIKEISRILRPKGKAYLSASRGSWSYVDKVGWEKILEGFSIIKRGDGSLGGDRWAVVSKKPK